MIVVAIIAILAAIAIPVYASYVAKAQFTEALSLASGLKPAVSDAYERQGAFDSIDNGTQSIPPATDIAGRYVVSLDVKNGVIAAHFSNASRLNEQTMTLTPDASGGSSIQWVCSTTAPASRSPASCR